MFYPQKNSFIMRGNLKHFVPVLQILSQQLDVISKRNDKEASQNDGKRDF